MIKRHTKPTKKENKGGIISKENYIQSNIKNIDKKKIKKL